MAGLRPRNHFGRRGWDRSSNGLTTTTRIWHGDAAHKAPSGQRRQGERGSRGVRTSQWGWLRGYQSEWVVRRGCLLIIFCSLTNGREGGWAAHNGIVMRFAVRPQRCRLPRALKSRFSDVRIARTNPALGGWPASAQGTPVLPRSRAKLSVIPMKVEPAREEMQRGPTSLVSGANKVDRVRECPFLSLSISARSLLHSGVRPRSRFASMPAGCRALGTG